MTFIENKAIKKEEMKVFRSTEYDWLKKEEEELEEWKNKKRRGFYKLGRELT